MGQNDSIDPLIAKYNQDALEYAKKTGTMPETYSGGRTLQDVQRGLAQIGADLSFVNSLGPQSFKPSFWKDTPEYNEVMEILNGMTEGGLPGFTPKYVTQWQGKVNEMYAPFEADAMKQLRNEQSFMAPLGGRTSIMDRQIGELINKYSAQKMQTALGLGQNMYNTELQNFINGLKMKGDLSQAANNQIQQNYLTNLNRRWQKSDMLTQRGWANEDYLRQEALARELEKIRANANKRNPWDNVLQGLGSAAGMIVGNAVLPGIGGSIGGMLGGSATKPKTDNLDATSLLRNNLGRNNSLSLW